MAGRVYIETYGCALNRGDSALMAQLLRENGYTLVESEEQADIIIVNTCTVRRDTEERISKRLRKLAGKGKARIIVAGCMASAQPYTVKTLAPQASLVSTENAHRILEAVENNSPIDLLEPSAGKRDLVPHHHWGVIATIPLVDGCLGDCSFCLTVRARRRLLSRRPRRVLEVVRRLVERGVVELQFTGQDLAAYGYDLEGRPLLPDLLEEILSRVEGDYMIRLGMMTPELYREVADRLLPIMRDPRVYRFLHLPVQSGDDRVLRLMNRRYTAAEYEELVREARARLPGVYIATDIIVGHPGEDEEAFNATLELVKRLRFDRIHVAQYTPRPFTRSARLPQVPDRVKKERSRRLMELYARIGLERNLRYVGKTLPALVVEEGVLGRDTFTARLSDYNSIVIPRDPGVRLGTWVRVRVTDATFFDLRGRLAEYVGEERGEAPAPIAWGPRARARDSS